MCVLLKITRPWQTFLKIAISISRNIRIKIVWFYCISFVYGTSSFIKSLIWYKLTCRLIVKIWRHRFCRRQYTQMLKTAFIFIFYFRKSLLHTSRIHNTEYFCKKKLFSITPKLTEKTWKQELSTHLVHDKTGSWRNTEYNWPQLMTIKLISKTFTIYSIRIIVCVVACL